MPEDEQDELIATLVRDCGWELVAYARRRLPASADAEGVVQEALLGLVETGGTIEQPRAMAFALLRRRIVDELRKTDARERHEQAAAELAGPTRGFRDDGFRSEAVGRWSADPAAVAQSDEFWRAFEAAVDALPPKQRQAYCLKELDGEPTSRVCELLGVQPPGLWGLIHRARLSLRGRLGGFFEDRDERR